MVYKSTGHFYCIEDYKVPCTAHRLLCAMTFMLIDGKYHS